MTARGLAPLAALAAAALCAGCRSNGGIDRADGADGMRFSTSRLAEREAESCDATVETVRGVPGWIATQFEDGWEQIAYTYRLYLDGHGEK